jgi:hypothetical protein
VDLYSLVRIMSEGINRGHLPLVSFFNNNFDFQCYFQHPSNVAVVLDDLITRRKIKNPYPRVVVSVVSLLDSVPGKCLLVSMLFVLIFAFASTGFD